MPVLLVIDASGKGREEAVNWSDATSCSIREAVFPAITFQKLLVKERSVIVFLIAFISNVLVWNFKRRMFR